MERLFEDMGEPIDTLVGVIVLKPKTGLRSFHISMCSSRACGNIGRGNMPTLLADSSTPHHGQPRPFNPDLTQLTRDM